MIYVTGDVHADLGRFKGKAAKKLKKGDTLIVCGDFGFVWDGSKKEQRVLKWLGRRRYSVLFVEGTHDNLDLLAGRRGRSAANATSCSAARSIRSRATRSSPSGAGKAPIRTRASPA